MNKEIYIKIFDNYLNNFNMLNSPEHKEYFKWEMVRHFRDCWNPDADDYCEMLKESVFRQTAIFLDNHITCPAAGLIKLASHSEALDYVKSQFEILFKDDNGDISNRQNRIQDFVDNINNLLDIYEPGKWRYKQEFRTALAYLTFYDPAHNYFYKATEAKQMAEMIDFGGDIGSGRTFSLKNYYLMCSNILEQAKGYQPLMDANHGLIAEHNSNEEYLPMCDYDDDHILVFDLIYAGRYGIYSDLYYPIHMRKSSKKKNQNLMKIDELTQELQNQKNILEECMLKKSDLDGFSAVGLKVVHRAYGEGTIIDQDDNRVLVKIDDTNRWFKLPDAFTKRFLDTEVKEAKELMLTIDGLNKEISLAKNRIVMYQSELDNLK